MTGMKRLIGLPVFKDGRQMGTVERGVLTVYVCACVFAAAGVVWLRGGLTVCVCACVCAAAGVVCVYVLLQVIFYCLNYSI